MKDKGNKNVQLSDKKEYKAEDFAEEYQSLCNRTGFNLVGNPAFVKRDDGTYSITLQFSIGKVSKE